MSPVPEGLPLHVEEQGEGPPLLLLHGFGASSFTFRHWIPELARDHRVIAVDLKGFGRAPKPRDGRYGIRDLAGPVVELLDRMDRRGTGPVTLVGHSLGGGVALTAALELLDRGELHRLRALVSVAGVAYRQSLPPLVSLAGRSWERLSGGPGERLAGFPMAPARWLARRTLRSIVYDPSIVDAEQVRGYARPYLPSEDPSGSSTGARVALLEAARRILPENVDTLEARYPELDLPALLLWGRHDRVVPAWVGERLRSDLPRARLVVLERCGHLPPEEAPERSLRILRDFLGDLPPTAGREPGADPEEG